LKLNYTLLISMFILIMSSVLPKNIQSVLVTDITTSSSIIAPVISTGNLYSGYATIPTIMMTGSFHATHTNNTIANIFTTAGNVGIGTTAPNSRLEVNGTIKSGDITVGNINFTGSLYQNGLAYLGSQWTTTSGNTITYTSGNVIVNSGFNSSFNSNTLGSLISTGGNIGINTTSPGTRLDVSGTGRITTSLTTGALYSTNQTTTNIVSTNLSTGTLSSTTMSTALLTASTSVTTGALFSTNQTTTNIVGTNITTSNITVTSGGLSATFNSNTIGNIFTTGGNVGIGVNPVQQLHINTSLAVNNLTFLGNPTSGSARLNIRDVSQQLIEFQYSSNTIGNITSFAGIPGIRFNGGGGVNQFVLASTGNIGLGTTSPSVKFQVEDGSVIFGDSTYISTSVPSAPGSVGTANEYRLFFDNSHNATAGAGIPANKIVLHNNNWTGGFGIEGNSVTYHSGYSHTFYGNATNTSTYGNAIMMINGAGRVGIMTTSPDTTLHINGPSLQMGTSTNAFNFLTTTGSLYLSSGTIGSSYITSFTSTGNVGIGTSTPSNRLDVVGTIRASAGILLSSSNVTEFGHGISGKHSDAGKIGYNTWTTGLNIVGAGTGASDRLVYIYDHLQVATAVTIPNLRITGATNITGNASVQATTNNYTLTSGALNVTGDIVLSGSELMFTTTGVGTPTMNGRGSGSKIVLYPETGVGFGDYSIGVESAYTWFQVPSSNHGYKFYQGTSSNFVIATNGNVGIGTTGPVTKLHVDGNLLLSLGSRLATASISDNFIYSGATVGHYSLLWNNDTAEAGGAMSYISGYGGLRIFSNGTPRLNLTRLGNLGIGTTSPGFTLDVSNTTRLQNDFGITANSAAWNSTLTKGLYMRYSTNGVQDAGYIQSIDRSTTTWYPLSIQGRQLTFSTNGGDGSERMIITSTGNVGIGTTSPNAKLHIIGNGGSSNIFEGVDHAYLQLYPFGYAAGRKAYIGFPDANNKSLFIYNEATAGNIVLNTTALGGSIQFINNTTTAVTITGGNVGIGTGTPAYLLDVNGTIDALTVTTGNLSNGTATIGTLLNNNLINYGVSAQWVINGGGTATWTGTSLLWSERVIVIPVKKSEYGSNGHFDISCPTSGTITYYNSANVTTTVTCTASGIPMTDWEALYYEITPGQSNTSDQTKFRLVQFGNSTWKPTSNWILIAVRNGDTRSLKWIPGNSYIAPGATFNNFTIFNSSGVIGIGTTQPATGHTTTIPNARLSILSGVSGNNGGTSRISIGGDNSHYSAIEGAHTASGATTLAFLTCLNASTNSANPLTRMFIEADGDIGINTTVPGYRLDVNGAGGFRGNLYVNTAGAGATPQLNVSPNTNAAESSIAFWQNTNNSGTLWVAGHNPGGAGSDKFAIYNSTFGGNALTIQNDGNVGLNINSPGTRLHVYQNRDNEAGILCENPNSGASAYAALRLKTNAANNGYIFLNSTGKTNDGPALCMTMRNDTGDLRLQSAGANGIYISSTSGNVGIGTTPSSKLHIFEASGTVAGANSGSIILDHDNSGGASSITFRSKVNRGSDFAYIQYLDAATAGGAGETSRFIIGVQNDADDHIILDPSGSVGIGTYSPGFKLHVNGNMRADNIYNNGWFRNYGDQGLYNEDYGCHFYRNDTLYGNWRIHGNAVNNWNGLRFTQAEISVMAGEGATRTSGFHYNNVGWAMMLDASRNMYVTGDITAYWSDRRLKTNLQKLDHFDDVLTSLTGYSFNWNEKGQEILQKPADELDVGLIAQDVQAVIPQAVKVNKAGQKIDEPDPFEYLTINYDKIVPFLIEGYKAQRGEIQAQRGEINELKSKIESLENIIQQLLTK
jgi:hypothetical protein